MDLGATAAHERRLLERVEDAAAQLEQADAVAARAREVRDQAVRAAILAGVHGQRVAIAAGVSRGMVSRLANARRG